MDVRREGVEPPAGMRSEVNRGWGGTRARTRTAEEQQNNLKQKGEEEGVETVGTEPEQGHSPTRVHNPGFSRRDRQAFEALSVSTDSHARCM